MGAKSRLQITPRKFSRQQPTFGSLHLFLLRCSPIGRYSSIVVVKSQPKKISWDNQFISFCCYILILFFRDKNLGAFKICGANFEIILPRKHYSVNLFELRANDLKTGEPIFFRTDCRSTSRYIVALRRREAI